MEIIWSKNAQITYNSIINYLEINFGVLNTKKFIAKTESRINSIATFPEIYKAVSLKHSVRKAVITKQCSFYYEINKNTIVILYFWDNRQEPIEF
jgi:plasmid stabilization system protein ParE